MYFDAKPAKGGDVQHVWLKHARRFHLL